jgi:hypothetical protein
LGLWLFSNIFLKFGSAACGGCSLVTEFLGCSGAKGQASNTELNIKFCGLSWPEFHTRNIPAVRRIFHVVQSRI